jgi:hypothetical protein
MESRSGRSKDAANGRTSETANGRSGKGPTTMLQVKAATLIPALKI